MTNIPFDGDLRLVPARPDLAAAHLEGAVTAARFVTGAARTVAAASAPLRAVPSLDAQYETELLFGEGFIVYEEKDGWAWGQSALDGYVGYVRAALLGPAGAAKTHRVTALRACILPRPDFKAPPAMIVSMNAQLALAGREGRFLAIEGGGYIFADHAAPLDATVTDYVAVAEEFLGAPYLFGGRTSIGVDCSALVQLALARAGIKAPRDSDLQEPALGDHLAARLDGADLQRGDLVFWNGHVGVMTDARALLHANATYMQTVRTDVFDYAAKVERAAGPVVSVRRLSAGAAGRRS